jgi:predicted nucleic acid-binding protein
MPYLVDSNIVIDNLLDVPTASALLKQLALDGVAISIVTYIEAFQGIYHSPDPQKAREKFETFVLRPKI